MEDSIRQYILESGLSPRLISYKFEDCRDTDYRYAQRLSKLLRHPMMDNRDRRLASALRGLREAAMARHTGIQDERRRLNIKAGVEIERYLSNILKGAY